MSSGRTITLNTGAKFPVLGLGTWISFDYDPLKDGEAAKNFILNAIKIGYRHIDTAWGYKTETAVGEAIRESGIPREEFFIVTKIWSHHHRRVDHALDLSLKNLGFDYVDLLLMHWPQSFEYHGDAAFFPTDENGHVKFEKDWSYVDTWKAMEKLPKDKVHAIGVSNFSEKTLAPLLKETTIVPAVNQIELHPYLQQNSLRDYCHQNGIVLTAYSPLGQGDTSVLKEDSIKAIAKKHDATDAQVVLSWVVSVGDTVVVKSSNPERLKSNFKYIKLDDDDRRTIEVMDRNVRLANGRDREGLVFGWSLEQLGW